MLSLLFASISAGANRPCYGSSIYISLVHARYTCEITVGDMSGTHCVGAGQYSITSVIRIGQFKNPGQAFPEI